jgi:hypothetical protein
MAVAVVHLRSTAADEACIAACRLSSSVTVHR